VIVLPNERTGLAALEEKLSTQTLAEMLERTTKAKVNLYLPKFKVETTLDLEHHLSTVSIFYNKTYRL
jgi:serine protease inhibitor